MKQVLLVSALFILGVILGYNLQDNDKIWDGETYSLKDLNKKLATDGSERLAILVITQKGYYYLVKGHNEYQVFGGLMDRQNNIIMSNLNELVRLNNIEAANDRKRG